MCAKRVSPSYFIYILSCFVLFSTRESEKLCHFFFPFQKGLNIGFWPNFFPTSPPSKRPSLSPQNERVASLNYWVVLLANSVKIIKKMILLWWKGWICLKRRWDSCSSTWSFVTDWRLQRRNYERHPKFILSIWLDEVLSLSQ